MKKVLFTTPILEHPAAGGPQLRIENSIKALNMITELHVVSRVQRFALGGGEAEKYFRSICYRFEYSPSARSNNVLNIIAKYRVRIKNVILSKCINLPFRFFNKIYNFIVSKIHNYSVEDVRFIKSYVIKHQIDIVWFGYGNISYDMMKALKDCLPETKMVCDTDSVWSRFILRELNVEKDPIRIKEIETRGKAKEAEEKSWVEFMDVTTAVSEIDADYYRSISTDFNKIKIFSNVIDVEMYKKQPPPKNFKTPCIYLTGTFGHYHSPMDSAARWVIEEVYPIVKKSIPEIHFYIVGKESEKLLEYIHDNSITITGKVDTVLPYLCNADVSLVPLKFESGTRFKILEAGACKRPVVSTTLGAEGLPVIHGKNILIADSPNDFANAVIKLIRDKLFANYLAENLYLLVSSKFSIKSLEMEARNILNSLKVSK